MSKNQNGKFGVQLKKVNVNNFSRIVAYIIDWYVATMVSSIPIVIITSIVNHTTVITQELNKLPLMWGVITGILAIIFYLGYYFVLELKVYKGQTFGKRIMKLKVVKDDGNDVDFKSILLREGLGVMIIEGYLANSSSYLRQIIQLFTDVNIMDISVYLFGMIHDHIAKTHIISTKEEQV